MDNEWKKSLRERFSDYSAPEPEGLWEGIEQGIAGKPRRKLLPVWLVSGAAVAAAVALGVFLHPEKTPETPDLQKQGNLAESVRKGASTESVTETVVAAPAEEPVAEPVEAAPARSIPFGVVSRQTLVAAAPADPVPVPADLVPDTVPDENPAIDPETVPTGETPVSEKATDVPESAAAVPESTNETHREVVIPPEAEPAIAGVPPRNPPQKRFSIGAYGNGGQGSAGQTRGVGMNQTQAYMTRAIWDNTKNDMNAVVRMLASNQASTFQVRHSAPLRAGVTFSYGLTPHLSLVSGVNWTYLGSEFEESAGMMRTVTAQDLGYLGVPLRLEAGVRVWKWLWLHAGVGGMVEKGLMGSSRTDTWVDGRPVESVRNPRPDMGGLLWSVGALAGAELRFSPSIGLYVSPGLEYHFDNGAPIRSAYTEKPLGWSVNVGARFHFGE